MSKGNEAMSMGLAALALGMIRQDPELVKRLREHAAKDDFPWDTADINKMVLELAEMDVLEQGQKILEDSPEQNLVAGAVVPIPHFRGAAFKSAQALSAGSFATEFVHSVPGRMDAFNSWLSKEHPDSAEGGSVDQEMMAAADRTLTLMARVADQIAQQRGEIPKEELDTSESESWKHG